MSTTENRSCWLIKFAPFRTSWAQIVKRGAFTMRGIRNIQARNNLAAMQVGDQVLFYHSQQERAVVGVCEVERQSSPDPTPRWLTVTFKPTRTLASPVPLSQIKATPELRQIGLIRQPRLSVMPLTENMFMAVLEMGTPRDTL